MNIDLARRGLWGGATATFALAAFLWIGHPPRYARAAETSAEASVKIDNFAFVPANLTVPAGTKVVWRNDDDIPHLVVADDNKAFRSAALDTGDTFSFTFAAPGSYAYFCALHPHMQGTIVVTP
jgi:plastocyanin